MANVTVRDSCLWIKHIGCELMQRALLALEPGAQIWLSIDGQSLLFERMQDGKDGRISFGLKPVGSSKMEWLARYNLQKGAIVDLDFAVRQPKAIMPLSGNSSF